MRLSWQSQKSQTSRHRVQTKRASVIGAKKRPQITGALLFSSFAVFSGGPPQTRRWALVCEQIGPPVNVHEGGCFIVKASGRMPRSIRRHVVGAAIGKFSRARGENVPIAVVPRPLR